MGSRMAVRMMVQTVAISSTVTPALIASTNTTHLQNSPVSGSNRPA